MRSLYDTGRWNSSAQLYAIRCAGRRHGYRDRGGLGPTGRAQRGAARLREASCAAMRVLHSGNTVFRDALFEGDARTGRAAGSRDAFRPYLSMYGLRIDRCRDSRSRRNDEQRLMTASRIKESPGGIASRIGKDDIKEERSGRLDRHIL